MIDVEWVDKEHFMDVPLLNYTNLIILINIISVVYYWNL